MSATTASQRALHALPRAPRMDDILAPADRDFLAGLVAAGGPLPDQYAELDDCLSRLYERNERGKGPPGALRTALMGLGGAFADPTSLVGKVLHAPRHGAYALMEDIYSNRRSEHPALHRWDAWFQCCAAAEAVRRRKEFLVRYLGDVASEVPAGSRVAVLGCGSCREVFEHIAACGLHLRFDCVDLDEDAIACAKRIGRNHARHVFFHQVNALRFQGPAGYALIMSAGLFDYFSDRLFVIALRRLGKLLRPGGELLIGNFSTANATRGPMGCAGWTLYERTAADLLRLARAAGYAPREAWVASEESAVNLFLEIRTPRW